MDSGDQTRVFMLAKLYCIAISGALFQTPDGAVVEKPTMVQRGVAGGTHLGEGYSGLLGKSIPVLRGNTCS